MNFGPDVQWGARFTTVPEFEKFLDVLQEKGYNEVDTAWSYQRGEQEAFTAAAHWKEPGLKLATKVSILWQMSFLKSLIEFRFILSPQVYTNPMSSQPSSMNP
jgi:predicted aldo/keto reductase-like oxidoreductase